MCLLNTKFHANAVGQQLLNNRLLWHEHTENFCGSFDKKVAVLKRINSLITKPVLRTIYYRIILPSVLYGIVVWGSCSQSLLEDIDRIHLKAKLNKLFVLYQETSIVPK